MPSWRVVSMDIINRGRGDLIGPLRDAVRREGRPTVAALQAAWLTVDVQSSKDGTARPTAHLHLRQRVAAATNLQVTSTGIRIGVRDRAIDPRYGRSLVWYLNGSGRPWRHPIFGRRARSQDWAVQRGQEVLFGTVSAHAPAFRAGIARAMEEVAREF